MSDDRIVDPARPIDWPTLRASIVVRKETLATAHAHAMTHSGLIREELLRSIVRAEKEVDGILADLDATIFAALSPPALPEGGAL
jgi:hypothetical protein